MTPANARPSEKSDIFKIEKDEPRLDKPKHPQAEWTDVEDKPFKGKRPPLDITRTIITMEGNLDVS